MVKLFHWIKFKLWWLCGGHREYKAFLKLVKEKGYNPKNIWWSDTTGYICMPDSEME